MSTNAIALVIMALSLIGVNIEENTLTEVLSAIGTLVSFAIMFRHQMKRTDIDLFFWRK